jgi:GTP-binding protein
MDVNPAKEKKATNIRSSTAELTEGLIPIVSYPWSRPSNSCARTVFGGYAHSIRLRKTVLGGLERGRRKKNATVGARP